MHLRFDVRASSLPDDVKERLLALRDQRITQDGVVVIKAQTERSRELNRADALRRLDELVASVAEPPRAAPRDASRRRPRAGAASKARASAAS